MPNTSFKPKLFRYIKHMAGTACHVFASATQFGLTQVLGPMRQILALAVTILLASVTGACASTPVNEVATLEIKTGGGITGPFFSLHLSPAGLLSVRKESLPFADTPSGLTTEKIQIHLSPQEASQLVALASSADDFSQGCGAVGHGTSAHMQLTRHGQTFQFSCNNAANWPSGHHTMQLVAAINKHLPKRLHVF